MPKKNVDLCTLVGLFVAEQFLLEHFLIFIH